MRKLVLLALSIFFPLALCEGQGISGAGSFGCSGVTVTGTAATSATANNTDLYTALNIPAYAAKVQLDQTSTISGGAITFLQSDDGGVNYITIPTTQVLNEATGQQLTNPYTLVASTNQPFYILLNGNSSFKVRLTTVITGTATVTPEITLVCQAPTAVQLITFDANNNAKVVVNAALPAGSNVIGALTANQSVNVAQVNGNTTSTAATGVQKVGVVGNAGAIVDAATNATPPANGVQPVDVSATALPAAVTATNTVAPMADKFGRQIVIPFAMRDLIKTAAVQTTNATQTTLLASQASQFADLVSLTITNESATPCTVALTDGTTTYKFNVANTQGSGFTVNYPTPLPAASTATAWQVTGCASVTLDYVSEFVLNK